MALRIFTHDHRNNAATKFFCKVREIWGNVSNRPCPVTAINNYIYHVEGGLNAGCQCFNVDDKNTHLIIAHMHHAIDDEGAAAGLAQQNQRLYFVLLHGNAQARLRDQNENVMILPRDPDETPGLEEFVRHLANISDQEGPAVNLRLLLPNPIPEATLAYKLVLLAQQKEVNIQIPDGLEDQVREECKRKDVSWPEQEGITEDKISAAKSLIEKTYGKK